MNNLRHVSLFITDDYISFILIISIVNNMGESMEFEMNNTR